MVEDECNSRFKDKDDAVDKDEDFRNPSYFSSLAQMRINEWTQGTDPDSVPVTEHS